MNYSTRDPRPVTRDPAPRNTRLSQMESDIETRKQAIKELRNALLKETKPLIDPFIAWLERKWGIKK